jgi:hypothetical protein
LQPPVRGDRREVSRVLHAAALKNKDDLVPTAMPD